MPRRYRSSRTRTTILVLLGRRGYEDHHERSTSYGLWIDGGGTRSSDHAMPVSTERPWLKSLRDSNALLSLPLTSSQ
jgi:hypothetical protein